MGTAIPSSSLSLRIGSFEEFIVPTGKGVPNLFLVSDDGNHIMLSGEYLAPNAPDPDHGLYTMTLARSIPEFGTSMVFVLVALMMTGIVFFVRAQLVTN